MTTTAPPTIPTTTTTTQAPTTTTTTLNFTANGAHYSTGSSAVWNLAELSAFETYLTSGVSTHLFKIATPPPSLFNYNLNYKRFRNNNVNPTLQAVPVKRANNLIPFGTLGSSSGYMTMVDVQDLDLTSPNNAFLFPVSTNIGMILTDGSNTLQQQPYYLLTEEANIGNSENVLTVTPWDNVNFKTNGATTYVQVGETYTIGTVSLTNYGLNGLNVSGIATVDSCLLEGTMVETPNGPVKIESIRVGDYVLNKHRLPVRVTDCLIGRHNIQTAKDYNRIFKVPRGRFGAKMDVYLTWGHRVMSNHGLMVLPERLGCQQPDMSEYCDVNGKYTVYHLEVEAPSEHFIVNGGCIVESWK